MWKLRQTQRKRPKRHSPNKARERWNDKGEINNGLTAGNGVGASSLEIRNENVPCRLPCGHPYILQIQSRKVKRCRGTTSTFGCCPDSDFTTRSLTSSVRNSFRGISHSKRRWFWKVQLAVFSDLFARINALQPNRSPEKVLNKWVIDCFFSSNVGTHGPVCCFETIWNDFVPKNCLSRPFNISHQRTRKYPSTHFPGCCNLNEISRTLYCVTETWLVPSVPNIAAQPFGFTLVWK